VISPTQGPLPENTQHSQQTNIYVLGEIRTHNPSKRAAADLTPLVSAYYINILKPLYSNLDVKGEFIYFKRSLALYSLLYFLILILTDAAQVQYNILFSFFSRGFSFFVERLEPWDFFRGLTIVSDSVI
jgi:hypothetical protein